MNRWRSSASRWPTWRPDGESWKSFLGPPRPAARGQRCESVGAKMFFFLAALWLAERQVGEIMWDPCNGHQVWEHFNAGSMISMFCFIPQQCSNPSIWSFHVAHMFPGTRRTTSWRKPRLDHDCRTGTTMHNRYFILRTSWVREMDRQYPEM